MVYTQTEGTIVPYYCRIVEHLVCWGFCQQYYEILLNILVSSRTGNTNPIFLSTYDFNFIGKVLLLICVFAWSIGVSRELGIEPGSKHCTHARWGRSYQLSHKLAYLVGTHNMRPKQSQVTEVFSISLHILIKYDIFWRR